MRRLLFLLSIIPLLLSCSPSTNKAGFGIATWNMCQFFDSREDGGEFSGWRESDGWNDEKYNEILGNKIETVFDVWGGCSGIQSGFQATFSEGVVKRGVSPTVIANTMSVQPAKAFGIYGKKGDIKVGFDADLLIVDPEKEWEITSESLLYVNKISAFVGLKGKGLPVMTLVRGNVIAENGKIVAQKGIGELVKKIK